HKSRLRPRARRSATIFGGFGNEESKSRLPQPCVPVPYGRSSHSEPAGVGGARRLAASLTAGARLLPTPVGGWSWGVWWRHQIESKAQAGGMKEGPARRL